MGDTTATDDGFKASKNFSFRFEQRQLIKLKNVFDSFDDDCDGQISLEFLGTALRAGGLLITEKDTEQLKRDIDPQNRGVIELGTFFITMARLKRDSGDVDEQVSKAFDKISKDFLVSGDKKIAPTILRNMLSGRGGEVLSQKETDEFIKKMDAISDKKNGTFYLDDLKAVILTDKPIDSVRVEVNERANETLKTQTASRRSSRRSRQSKTSHAS